MGRQDEQCHSPAGADAAGSCKGPPKTQEYLPLHEDDTGTVPGGSGESGLSKKRKTGFRPGGVPDLEGSAPKGLWRIHPSGEGAGRHPWALHHGLAGVRPFRSYHPLHRRPLLLSGTGRGRENPPSGGSGQGSAFPGSTLPVQP